jgi:hypothetical protein
MDREPLEIVMKILGLRDDIDIARRLMMYCTPEEHAVFYRRELQRKKLIGDLNELGNEKGQILQ